MAKNTERIRKAYRFPVKTVIEIEELRGWQLSNATAAIVRAVHEAWERETKRRGIDITDGPAAEG